MDNYALGILCEALAIGTRIVAVTMVRTLVRVVEQCGLVFVVRVLLGTRERLAGDK